MFTLTQIQPELSFGNGSGYNPDCVIEILDAVEDESNTTPFTALFQDLGRHGLYLNEESAEVTCRSCPVLGKISLVGGSFMQEVIDREKCTQSCKA